MYVGLTYCSYNSSQQIYLSTTFFCLLPSWSLHIIIKCKHSSYKEDHLNWSHQKLTLGWWTSYPSCRRQEFVSPISQQLHSVCHSLCVLLPERASKADQMCSVWICSGVTSFYWQTENKAKSNQPDKERRLEHRWTCGSPAGGLSKHPESFSQLSSALSVSLMQLVPVETGWISQSDFILRGEAHRLPEDLAGLNWIFSSVCH